MRALLLALVLVGCGSGAVSDPSTAPQAPALSVSPPAATAYPKQPTTFIVAGGIAPYTATSSNQAIVPSPTVSNGGFTIIPAAVSAQTIVTLTVHDSASHSQTVQVTVEPLANAPLVVRPATIAFQGTAPSTCASSIQADVLIFGGQPPYVISQPPNFLVSPLVLPSSGRVTVTANGRCSAGEPLAVIDSLGSSATVTLSNTQAAAVAPTPFSVAPLGVTLNSCQDSASVLLLGGSGHYFAASGNSAVAAGAFGTNFGIIFRNVVAAGTTVATPVPVVFSDGASSQTVIVTLAPGARGDCQ